MKSELLFNINKIKKVKNYLKFILNSESILKGEINHTSLNKCEVPSIYIARIKNQVNHSYYQKRSPVELSKWASPAHVDWPVTG